MRDHFRIGAVALWLASTSLAYGQVDINQVTQNIRDQCSAAGLKASSGSIHVNPDGTLEVTATVEGVIYLNCGGAVTHRAVITVGHIHLPGKIQQLAVGEIPAKGIAARAQALSMAYPFSERQSKANLMVADQGTPNLMPQAEAAIAQNYQGPKLVGNPSISVYSNYAEWQAYLTPDDPMELSKGCVVLLAGQRVVIHGRAANAVGGWQVNLHGAWCLLPNEADFLRNTVRQQQR
jgi:hypothetical protein